MPVTVQLKASNQSNDQLTYDDVADLGVEVGANATYAIQWLLTVDAAAATTGIQIAVNGPDSPELFTATIMGFVDLTTPVVINTSQYDAGLDLASSAGGLGRVNCTITATLVNGPNSGVVNARFRSEVSGSAITIYKGSRVVYYSE